MAESPITCQDASSAKARIDQDPILCNDWHALARSQDLPSGTVLRGRLLEKDLVLWRDNHAQIFAWEDRCPHRGIRLSAGRVVGNTLICPYHGLVFNHEGRCIKVPAHPDYLPPKQMCLQTYRVQECYGLIFICLGVPQQDVPSLPEWTDPSYRRYLCGPYHYQSSGLRVIENFLDVAHFTFVHGGSLAAPCSPVVNDYEVSVEQDGIRLHNVRVWQPDPDGTGQSRLVTNNYRVFRPLTAYFSRESPQRRLTLFFTVAPVEEEKCIGWMWVSMNYAHDIPEEELRAFQDRIVAQDTQIVESQYPRRLPLNLQAEFHLPCDRASITYRKWLHKLGVTFGAIAK